MSIWDATRAGPLRVRPGHAAFPRTAKWRGREGRTLVCPSLSFFSSRRRHTRCLNDWSSDVCSSDLGPGVALPTRMRFKHLPPELRPNSAASGNTPSDAGTHISRDLLSTEIERCRSARRSHRGGSAEFADYNSPLDAAPLQPAAPAMPMPVPPSPRGEALRSSLLKKPLTASSFGSPPFHKS